MTTNKDNEKTDAELIADANKAVDKFKTVSDKLKALAAQCESLILP